ncbi:MAG: HD family phosphohydrolase [Clostridia bacterium]|nr:HD family phosphohydrolase [Clostridia bacterium]
MFLGNAIATSEVAISDESKELFAIGSHVNLLNKNEEYHSAVKDLIENEITMQMKTYIQHGHTTCYQHCINVSYYSYVISKALHLDAISSARAGLLHDLFLYDWHTLQEKVPLFEMHGFTHPQKALNNAKLYFELNKKEEDIISKHMWPLTMKLPKYRESFIVIVVDKICCIAEFLREKKWFKLLFGLSYNQSDFMKK